MSATPHRLVRSLRAVAAALGIVLVYVLIWAGLVCLVAAAGIHHYWGRISVSQMMMNLSVQSEGGGGSLVWQAVLGVGVAPVVVTALIALAVRARRRRIRGNGGDGRSRRRRWAGRAVCLGLVAALTIGGTSAFARAIELRDYVASLRSGEDIGASYVQPRVTSDKNRRNIVVIYLESGEQTLANDQLFEKDAFRGLEDATKSSDGWKSIQDYQQYEGGGWTMAGIASTQCGVPLKGSGDVLGGSEAVSGDEGGSSYLGGLTCFGDVLARHGYTNAFLGGANSSFAAKDKFLATHGYTEDKGLEDWKAAGEDAKNFRSDWGLSDQRLMAHAKEETDRLHAEAQRTGKPFNLSMLTLDTHEPVHVYDYCHPDTKNQVTSVYACSMDQVADYVRYMKQKGYLKDTAVVVMGDHLKHMSAGDAFHEQLDHNTDRSIFNRIWIPGEAGKKATVRNGVDQLSMYPTMLEAAGLELADRSAGLGVSAFSDSVPTGSAQALPTDEYRRLLDSASRGFYARAWQKAA